MRARGLAKQNAERTQERDTRIIGGIRVCRDAYGRHSVFDGTRHNAIPNENYSSNVLYGRHRSLAAENFVSFKINALMMTATMTRKEATAVTTRPTTRSLFAKNLLRTH